MLELFLSPLLLLRIPFFLLKILSVYPGILLPTLYTIKTLLQTNLLKNRITTEEEKPLPSVRRSRWFDPSPKYCRLKKPLRDESPSISFKPPFSRSSVYIRPRKVLLRPVTVYNSHLPHPVGSYVPLSLISFLWLDVSIRLQKRRRVTIRSFVVVTPINFLFCRSLVSGKQSTIDNTRVKLGLSNEQKFFSKPKEFFVPFPWLSDVYV